MEDAIDDFGRRRAAERHPAGRELEQHDTQGEEIGTAIDFPAERLLRRHVRHRADDRSRDGHLRLGDGHGLRVGLDELREAEIEHLHEAALGAHQIRALDVAMHDAAVVSFVQRVRHLQPDLEHFPDRHRALRDARRQQLAFDVLHHDEVAAAGFADVVGDRDVGRTEQRCGARFVQEPRPALRVGLEVGGQELQRDRSSQPDVFSAVDLAHAAGAEALADAIVLNGRTGQSVHGDVRRKSQTMRPKCAAKVYSVTTQGRSPAFPLAITTSIVTLAAARAADAGHLGLGSDRTANGDQGFTLDPSHASLNDFCSAVSAVPVDSTGTISIDGSSFNTIAA